MKIFLILSLFVNILSSSEMQKVYIEYEGDQRQYLFYVPENFNNLENIDLVVGLHGYNGTASGFESEVTGGFNKLANCLLYTSPSPRDKRQSRMPSSA